jgi:hypothetical protein
MDLFSGSMAVALVKAFTINSPKILESYTIM